MGKESITSIYNLASHMSLLINRNQAKATIRFKNSRDRKVKNNKEEEFVRNF
jgi:hypothetical protein